MRNFPYKILIPSYQRAGRASTIDFLRGGVYGCEDIIVSTQTEDDYQAYKKPMQVKPLSSIVRAIVSGTTATHC